MQITLISATRVGKTDTATYVHAVHPPGDYPKRETATIFLMPPLSGFLGYFDEKCRDLLQTQLLGRKTDNGWQSGLIPGEWIADTKAMMGTTNVIRTAYICYVSGQ
ncbi:MAG TPA: hypothetical protein ACHBZA_12830 [Arsenophonus apicola]